MNKKAISFLFVTLMCITCYTIVPAQIIPATENTTTLTQESLEIISTEVLSTVTLGELTTAMRNHIETTITNPVQKTQLLHSLDQSIQELNTLGITAETPLIKAKTRLGEILQNRANTKYRNFLFGFFPVLTTMSTFIPPYETNLTEVPTQLLGDVPVKLELFVKVIPFFDFISIRQLGLTQSARIWPAIGGRITAAGITLCIIAFGPRIKWTRNTLR